VRKALVALFGAVILSFFSSGVFAQNMFRKVSDFDGDGKADFAVTRNQGGQKIWWIWQTTAGLRVVQWGVDFDQRAASDYDGDGKTDIAVYREPTSFPPVYTFYILESQTNTFSYKSFSTFANFGSRAVHQDYNGDGRTDAGVNTGEFGLTTQLSVIYSGSNSGFTRSIPPGGVSIRIGDMDGGGRADIAHYAFNSNVVTITSLETNTPLSLQFGIPNDQYQMADFDGDGKGDLTLWRSSAGDWLWIRSSDNTMQTEHWGMSGDFAVPADYDGDGRTDLAIWRPASPQSHYWVNGSSSGVSVFPWGIAGDGPVSY